MAALADIRPGYAERPFSVRKPTFANSARTEVTGSGIALRCARAATVAHLAPDYDANNVELLEYANAFRQAEVH